MERFTEQEMARFNTFWKKVGDCHVWQRYLEHGYGKFYFRKKGRKAHRVSYYFFNGPIPEGMVIDHICMNRACVNPQHLRAVTWKQSALENSNNAGAINSKKVTCKNGHPFDKVYGREKKQRYCSICASEKAKRLHKKWKAEADSIKC